jgi:RNA polymerase sigma-70 factor (ECF subfamily)
MYRLAVKMIGSNDAVHDIVQEVFVCLYEKHKDTKSIENYGGWLYRATYYKCADYLKQQGRFSKLEIVKNACVNDGDFEKKEEKEMVHRALNKLDTKVRFLVLLYSEGLSYKEMAEVTEIKFSSIGKTLSRALKKLEKELKEEYYELF